jgi:hypothetical protein
VTVAVGSGADRFKAEVRAESIEDAVCSAATIYPDGEVRVLSRSTLKCSSSRNTLLSWERF